MSPMEPTGQLSPTSTHTMAMLTGDLYDELLRWPTRYRSTLAIWSEEEALQRESEDLNAADFNLCRVERCCLERC